MMKIFGYECFKIFNKRLLLLLIPVLLVLNGFLYAEKQIKDNPILIKYLDHYNATEETYKKMQPDVALARAMQQQQELSEYSTLYYAIDNPDDWFFQQWLEDKRNNDPGLIERYDKSIYSQDIGLIRQDLMFSHMIYKQLLSINNYKANINSVQQKADDLLAVSIFQNETSFSYRNILKASGDFAPLKQIPLALGLEQGILSAAKYSTIDILITVLVLLLCIYLFHYERELNLVYLLRTNKRGRWPLVASKFAVLASLTTVLTALFYGTILYLANYLYGFGDTSRYIQSMEAFHQANLILTVKQYLAWFVAGKIAAHILLGIVIACLFILFDHASKAYIGIVVFLGFNYWAYFSIHSLSILNLLKFINLFAFYDMFSLLAEYWNINLFGFPINRVQMSITAISVALLFLPLIGMTVYVYRSQKKSEVWLASLLLKLQQRIVRSLPSVKLFVHEGYKSFMSGRGYISFILALAIGINGLTLEEVRFNEDNAFYNRYLDVLKGTLDSSKISYLEKEKFKFDHAKISGNMVDGQGPALEEKEAFNRVYKQYEHLLALKQDKGIEGSFVNEISSNYLFNESNRDLTTGLLYLLLLTLYLSVIFPLDYKNGMIAIVRSTAKGRIHAFAYKHAVGFLSATALMLILYTPQFFNYHSHYPIMPLEAPIQSIQHFKDIQWELSIKEFLILTILLQLAGSLIIAQCILFLSLVVRKQSLTLFIATALFVGPILIQLAGLEFIRSYSFNNVFAFNTAFKEKYNSGAILIYSLCLLAIGGIAMILGWNKYNRELLGFGRAKK